LHTSKGREALDPKALDQALGLSIRARRNAIGLTQGDLAKAVGVTFQQVQKYELGANRVSFSRLAVIAQALDCRIMDLVGELDSGPAKAAPPGRTLAHLHVIGALEVLAAYAAAPAPVRRAVRRLLGEIARAQGVGDGGDPTAP
jgi:transcriptional regulator with XRE-family HTH domain